MTYFIKQGFIDRYSNLIKTSEVLPPLPIIPTKTEVEFPTLKYTPFSKKVDPRFNDLMKYELQGRRRPVKPMNPQENIQKAINDLMRSR